MTLASTPASTLAMVECALAVVVAQRHGFLLVLSRLLRRQHERGTPAAQGRGPDPAGGALRIAHLRPGVVLAGDLHRQARAAKHPGDRELGARALVQLDPVGLQAGEAGGLDAGVGWRSPWACSRPAPRTTAPSPAGLRPPSGAPSASALRMKHHSLLACPKHDLMAHFKPFGQRVPRAQHPTRMNSFLSSARPSVRQNVMRRVTGAPRPTGPSAHQTRARACTDGDSHTKNLWWW